MTGQDLINIAETRKGCDYILGSLVPKNDADYKGSFDCAELVSWAVYQTIQKLYGCENDNASDPAKADAGTVYWTRDVQSGKVKAISISEARATPGAILLREAGDGLDGHIVISKGDGTTIEAKGHAWGVIDDQVDGRRWTTGILLSEIEYTTNEQIDLPEVHVLHIGGNNVPSEVVPVQAALKNHGYNVTIDGIYGPATAAAVRDFQNKKGLTPDGEVGPQTKNALGL